MTTTQTDDSRTLDDEGRSWFPLAFDVPFQLVSALVGVRPANAGVAFVDDQLVARFGHWVVTTPVTNVIRAEETGPFAWPKVIGAPHLSLADRGLTFAGNARAGLCLRFRTAVPGLEPTGFLQHPTLTVTLAEPDEFRAELDRRQHDARDAPPIDEQDDVTEAPGELSADEADDLAEAHDELEAMTKAELRDLARSEGLEPRSAMRKDELIDLVEQGEIASLGGRPD